MTNNVIDFNKALEKAKSYKGATLLTLGQKLRNNSGTTVVNEKMGQVKIFSPQRFDIQLPRVESKTLKTKYLPNMSLFAIVIALIITQVIFYLIVNPINKNLMNTIHSTVKYKDDVKLSQSMENLQKKQFKDFTENMFSVNSASYAMTLDKVKSPVEIKSSFKDKISYVLLNENFIEQLNSSKEMAVKTNVDLDKIKIIVVNQKQKIIEVPFVENWSNSKKISGTYYYELLDNELANVKKIIE